MVGFAFLMFIICSSVNMGFDVHQLLSGVFSLESEDLWI